MLTDPESRRGLRAIIQAVGALVSLSLLAWIIWISETQHATIYMIAGGLISLAGLRELFYGAENVTRALKFSISKDGVSADMGPDEAADAVAGAAVAKADEVKDAT